MKILIACEESQEVCKAFRERGHEAYSADILEPSGGHPEWHIYGDVLPLLNGHCTFMTMDGVEHTVAEKWDMLIAFPPCTHLAVSGARHFSKKRADGRQQAGIDFFMRMVNADCDMIAIENPIGIMSTVYRKPNQIIHPYEYGHPYRKATCLWLKGVENLAPTKIVEPEIKYYIKKNGKRVSFDALGWKTRDPKVRSKTFHGIAQAMAEQWGGVING